MSSNIGSSDEVVSSAPFSPCAPNAKEFKLLEFLSVKIPESVTPTASSSSSPAADNHSRGPKVQRIFHPSNSAPIQSPNNNFYYNANANIAVLNNNNNNKSNGESNGVIRSSNGSSVSSLSSRITIEENESIVSSPCSTRSVSPVSFASSHQRQSQQQQQRNHRQDDTFSTTYSSSFSPRMSRSSYSSEIQQQQQQQANNSLRVVEEEEEEHESVSVSPLSSRSPSKRRSPASDILSATRLSSTSAAEIVVPNTDGNGGLIVFEVYDSVKPSNESVNLELVSLKTMLKTEEKQRARESEAKLAQANEKLLNEQKRILEKQKRENAQQFKEWSKQKEENWRSARAKQEEENRQIREQFESQVRKSIEEIRKHEEEREKEKNKYKHEIVEQIEKHGENKKQEGRNRLAEIEQAMKQQKDFADFVQRTRANQIKKESQLAQVLKSQIDDKRRREKEEKQKDVARERKEIEKIETKVIKKILLRDPQTKKILPPSDFNLI